MKPIANRLQIDLLDIQILQTLIELQQFQDYMIKCMNDDECNNILEDIGSSFINFPSNVPQSQYLDIEYNSESKLDDVKLKAHELYNKYLAIGSEFQININGVQRNELIQIFDYKEDLMKNNDISFKDIIMLFQGPKAEMDMLLDYSFARFKREFEYLQVVQILCPSRSHRSNSIVNI